MRRLLIVCLAAAPLTAQAPDDHAIAVMRGVQFPEVIGTFAGARLTRYPEVDQGVSFSYLAPQFRAEISVYVYPVSEESAAVPLGEVFAFDWDVIQRYAQQVREATVEVLGDTAVTIVDDNAAPHAGFRGELTMTRGANVQSSQLYLFIRGHHFLKFRVTYDKSMQQQAEPEVQRFLASALATVKPAN